MKIKSIYFFTLLSLFLIGCKKDTPSNTVANQTGLPNVSTIAVGTITDSSATINSQVISDSGSTILERGVCWSKTNQNPTISDSKLSSGNGIGVFNVNISKLDDSSTYYVRSYATSSKGTGYGNVLNLKTLKKQVFGGSSTFVVKQFDLRGIIDNGIVILRSGNKFLLTGPLIVKNNAKLVIEPGVTIEGQTSNGASNLVISIERTGMIEAVGTSNAPILFTSTGTTPGSWGGICIHGQAPNNVGMDALSEYNSTLYGGNKSNDNSGILKYCVIKNAGAVNGFKEFNGISFFSVGSATIIEYVAVINGADDAFEWFGGTVNCSYLYAEDNDDDNFDYDEGYVGTLTFLYGKNANANVSADSRGIEGDNNPNLHTALPYSNPTVTNVSLIGRGSSFTGTQLEGIMLRRGVKSKISNVFLQGYKIGVGVQHDQTITNLTNGELKVTTIQMTDIPTKTTGKKTDLSVSDVSSVIVEGTSTGAGAGAAKPTWAGFVK